MTAALLRTAIYARYSTDLQRDASLDDQIRACREFATRQGLEVTEVYTDRATSGASLMRSGIQKLMRDAGSGRFDVVVAHALDRLSRNQADIATIYQQFQFSDVAIETVSEGSISELHIGLKGTMNAMFLRDLAQKTREGLRGRALDGKSAGGLTFGYRVVRAFAENGDRVRGDREIEPGEARVVQRIFQDYAKGLSPTRIAEALNREGIPGPRGGHWNTSTIHGNRKRGTGVINNEMYIGRQIWDRLTYRKNPATGKRVSFLNDGSELVITEIPELRIIEDELWQAVRQRQGALKSRDTGVPVWDRRRPKFLFSGLMVCGCCGGGFSKVSQDGFGCSASRKKGLAICSNRQVISKAHLEGAVLTALEHHLMDPDAVAAFCEAYTAERNRLRASATAGRAGVEKELAQVSRDHGKLVDAIVAGVPAEQVKDRMITLDARRTELQRQLDRIPAEDPVRYHPSMARTYRSRVGALIHGLGNAEGMEAAKEAVRALVDRIVLTPDPAGGPLTIDLQGAIAALLCLATGRPLAEVSRAANTKKASGGSHETFDNIEELVLVAGVGFEPTTFRL